MIGLPTLSVVIVEPVATEKDREALALIVGFSKNFPATPIALSNICININFSNLSVSKLS
jgi:hypothetical protein